MRRLEVILVNLMDQMPGDRQAGFNERVIDDQLGFLIRKLPFLSVSDLAPERFEIALNFIDADGDYVEQI